jgi:hypothetical protein
VHVEISGQGHQSRLQSASVGYGLEALAYVAGTGLIAAGVYLVMRGNFPYWWSPRLMWPLVNVTRRVSHLQGWAAIALGLSIIAIVFTSAAPELVGGVLVAVALFLYVLAVALYLFSTWLSRRPAA